ncbi:unnamed protein product [Ambrosiozyma monospora]|uniref:Unnamed protein product n=1 Tax=Ambrosiozyma monospora TaxID=43982 RepID=A0A9W6YSC5_AMBMO|nr:unnamed protein product [Ambrosiozyma monospora]
MNGAGQGTSQLTSFKDEFPKPSPIYHPRSLRSDPNLDIKQLYLNKPPVIHAILSELLNLFATSLKMDVVIVSSNTIKKRHKNVEKTHRIGLKNLRVVMSS